MHGESSRIVYVLGHRNPDTDSICAAIGYAHFKNLTDKRFLFTPARAGSVNEETVFALQRFGVPIPHELDSLAATVSDLELGKPHAVNARDSVQAVALMMRQKGLHTTPVVDLHGRFSGIVGLKDIAQHYVDSVGFCDLTEAPLSIDMLVKTLDCRIICNGRREECLRGRLLIGSMQKGTLLNRVDRGDIVILGDQHDFQLDLIHSGCSALIVTDGMPIDDAAVSAAGEQGALLLSSPHNAFATFQLMTMALPVEVIMSVGGPTARLDTPLSDLRKMILKTEYHAIPVIDNDDRLIGFVTRTDLLQPVRKRTILVDHNEISHAVEDVEDAEILEIIDHHRVGDISTTAPIYVYNDPVGSTCTLVAGIMSLYQLRIPAEIAGLLLSGILSDTLMLTLSTTTDRDRVTAATLAELAGVNLTDYGRELLQASIRIRDKSAAELVGADFRELQLDGKKLGISQMMVLDSEEIDLRKAELLSELERLRVIKGYDLVALLITNPLGPQEEHVLLKGETWMVEKAFNVEVGGDTCVLPKVMSRKKDFIPAIGKVLSMSGASLG